MQLIQAIVLAAIYLRWKKILVFDSLRFPFNTTTWFTWLKRSRITKKVDVHRNGPDYFR
jgi:hypothetical protein